MNVLLIILFVLGFIFGIFLRIFRTPSPQKQYKVSQHTHQSDIDDMLLYGEVNTDDFYRM